MRHPGRADAELGRTAAAGGHRLDHQIDVDAGFQAERHRLGGGGDVDGDQQIVDQLDLAGGAEGAEVMHDIAKAAHHLLGFLGGVGVAGEIDHRLARAHHAGRAADFAVEKDRALGGERRDLALLVGHQMRTELDDDLPGPRAMHQAVLALHHFVERFRRRQAGQHDVGLFADVGRRARRNAADLLEIGHRAAPIAEHAIAAFDQVFRDRQADFSHADETDRLHAASLCRHFSAIGWPCGSEPT